MCLSPDVVSAVFPMETGISDPFDLVKKLLHRGGGVENVKDRPLGPQRIRLYFV